MMMLSILSFVSAMRCIKLFNHACNCWLLLLQSWIILEAVRLFKLFSTLDQSKQILNLFLDCNTNASSPWYFMNEMIMHLSKITKKLYLSLMKCTNTVHSFMYIRTTVEVRRVKQSKKRGKLRSANENR